MAVQTQHCASTLAALGGDESGNALEPPDSSHPNSNTNVSSARLPPPLSKAGSPPSPAHLLLTHNNGPLATHIALSAPYSGPPPPDAPAGTYPPGRFRKLSVSGDHHPLVPSPLHTELKASDDGPAATPATVTSVAIGSTDNAFNDPEDRGKAKNVTAFPSLDQGDSIDESIEQEEEDENTTPTSSSACSSSDTAESERSRTSYESSVLAPISEGPDTSLSSDVSEDKPRAFSVDADVTPTTTALSGVADRVQDTLDLKPVRPTVDSGNEQSSTTSAAVDDVEDDTMTPTNSVIRTKAEATENVTTTAASSTSTASPTNLARSGSGRRLSCPTKATKTKLRPCFRRRASAQSAASAQTASSSDCEQHPARGRSVRFCPGPPQEVRTHSPVEYDRKSCAINHRLTVEDVEEMRRMEMGLGLLEAKWAAVAASKAAREAASTDHSEGGAADGAEGERTEAEIKFHSAAGVAGMRRSSNNSPATERDDTPVGRERERRAGTASGCPSGPSSRPSSSGSDRLAPPSNTGLSRRGTLTRNNSSSASASTNNGANNASMYNRADYSDSSESEYEHMPRRPGMYGRSLGSWSSTGSTRPKGNTDAPSAHDRGHGGRRKIGTSGPVGPGGSVDALHVWQPPDRCRHGYAGGPAGGIGVLGSTAAMARRCKSTTGVNDLASTSDMAWDGHGGPGTPSKLGASASTSSLPSATSTFAREKMASASTPPPPACHSSIIARFGLTSPPPPLPGMKEPPVASCHESPSHGPPGWGHAYASSAHSSPGSGHNVGVGGVHKGPNFFNHGQGAGYGGGLPSFKRTPPPPSPPLDGLADKVDQVHLDGEGPDADDGRVGRPSSSNAATERRARATSPMSSALSSSSCTSVSAASLSGYDSPASEFCYESGSEYELVG